VSSDVADFLVPYDSAAFKGGADEGTRDRLRVCPQGLWFDAVLNAGRRG
jgi:hypothetical protein